VSLSDTPKDAAREGSLDAPFRRPIDWRNDDYYDLDKVHAEMERVFDICHGCRRCFNLCDSFPRLFDMIDESPTGEIDGVSKADYAKVDEACTLCDMCFLTKCPYVPPHPFDLDFPHLILRYRAAKRKAGTRDVMRDQLSETDRNGKLAKPVAPIANWATAKENSPLRMLLEGIAGVDAEAELPKYHSKTATDRLKTPLAPDPAGPAFGRKKVAIYATCFVDYNEPDTAVAAARVLAKQGVEAKLVYPECCGMPQLEAGELSVVAGRAERVAAHFAPLIDQGYEVVALTASCALMMKFEWPLLLPDNAAVKALSAATRDICRRPVQERRAGAWPHGRRGRRHRPPRLPRPGPEHGGQVGGDAAADPRHAGRTGRALLGPRRHLRGDEEDPAVGGEDRQADRQTGGAKGDRRALLRLPAGVRPRRPDADRRTARRRGSAPPEPPDRDPGPVLRPGLRRAGCEKVVPVFRANPA
jgi:glycerol-3-phosphate dehydrogenase subunit C